MAHPPGSPPPCIAQWRRPLPHALALPNSRPYHKPAGIAALLVTALPPEFIHPPIALRRSLARLDLPLPCTVAVLLFTRFWPPYWTVTRQLADPLPLVVVLSDCGCPLKSSCASPAQSFTPPCTVDNMSGSDPNATQPPEVAAVRTATTTTTSTAAAQQQQPRQPDRYVNVHHHRPS